ncbi:MAG: cytochrome c oxidase subunit II [Acidobacteria bacterium]|nr:cytochrome c oxidase subunit II [Acidobacteriota bacterium]
MDKILFNGLSELGTHVDRVHVFIIAIMAFCFIACNAVLIYFMLRYRRKGPDDVTASIKGNHLLEAVWTIIPTIVVLIVFVYGVRVWGDMRKPPENAMTINVTGVQWAWRFEYPDGRIEAEDLYVPAGQPIRLNMVSNDVLHSFFIPELRVKEDVVPSQYTHLWFQADYEGVYNIFCTEYCGDNHSYMLGKVHALGPEAWDRWVRRVPDPDAVQLSPAERGAKLYSKWGCLGCHSTDGSPNIGPTFKNLMGRSESFADGSTVVVDENYIMESIKQPNAKIVAGFKPDQMPAFEGQLSQQDITDLIDYIKTLNE